MTRIRIHPASLRGKVAIGYGVLGALALLLLMLGFVELSVIERQVLASERVQELFDVTLELRRSEKNFFLYQEHEDYQALVRFVERSKELLTRQQTDFLLFTERASMVEVLNQLRDYRLLMANYQGAAEEEPALRRQREEEVRWLGKGIVDLTRSMAESAQTSLRESLFRHRMVWAISLVAMVAVAILAGHHLTRNVTRPLREMEENMLAIAQGSRRHLVIDATDQELVSLAQAFNRMLQELEVRQRHMLHAEKLASLGTLLAGVAHELNNPLSNISTSCQILMEEQEESDDPWRRELLHQIDEQTLRMQVIVRSLLNFAREQDFKRETLPLLAVWEETLRFNKGNVPSATTIALEIDPALTVAGDKRHLQQLFLNLVQNAVDAMAGVGQVVIRAARYQNAATGLDDPSLLDGACLNQGEWTEITVQDNGPGIPTELQQRIFDPFFTTKEVGQGSGLGLFVAHEIVTQHGGCLAVESLPGLGATFVIRLPADVPDPGK